MGVSVRCNNYPTFDVSHFAHLLWAENAGAMIPLSDRHAGAGGGTTRAVIGRAWDRPGRLPGGGSAQYVRTPRVRSPCVFYADPLSLGAPAPLSHAINPR